MAANSYDVGKLVRIRVSTANQSLGGAHPPVGSVGIIVASINMGDSQEWEVRVPGYPGVWLFDEFKEMLPVALEDILVLFNNSL